MRNESGALIDGSVGIARLLPRLFPLGLSCLLLDKKTGRGTLIEGPVFSFDRALPLESSPVRFCLYEPHSTLQSPVMATPTDFWMVTLPNDRGGSEPTFQKLELAAAKPGHAGERQRGCPLFGTGCLCPQVC